MSGSAGSTGTSCPSCGQPADPAAGSYCPHCGRSLAATRWVAEPPPTALPPLPVPIPSQYTGPPRYRERPHWGFPVGPWRWADPKPPPAAPERVARSLAGVAVPLLWSVAAVALLAAGAETWRYVLLLASRDGALSADEVAASDALVLAAGVGALLLALAAGAFLVVWTLQASAAAARRSGSRPSRSARSIVLGWLVPGLNLVVPGAVLAEIEHGALDRPAGRRPRPSPLVLAWWGLWTTGIVLSAFVLAWSRRTGVQAVADGVVLHAVLDLLAAVTAGVTAVLVSRLTALLGPTREVRREVVLGVGDAAVRDQAVTASSRNPRMTKSGRRRGGIASSMPGRRVRSASSVAATSSRASGAPRQ